MTINGGLVLRHTQGTGYAMYYHARSLYTEAAVYGSQTYDDSGVVTHPGSGKKAIVLSKPIQVVDGWLAPQGRCGNTVSATDRVSSLL